MFAFANFWVDDIYTSVPRTFTILQACSSAGIEVPRFCYHEKLSIAGNCRMCLVEVSNSKKLVASCAVPITENLRVYTNNLRVKKARESVLEFLLANHPLDCPICDQGGECDLQDITVSFGSDRGRFYEVEKRAVEDKYCGPLVKTVMTRCIHCTRCIRFISEVGGYPDLGTTGRGTKMEIGTYITKAFMDELSSNIVDLCPVGALTSKPYSFTSRPWELNNVESIDVFDILCNNIRLCVYGNKVKRILPRINEQLNEDWLANKSRYIYDSFDSQRVNVPLLNLSRLVSDSFAGLSGKSWISVSWKQVLLLCLYFLNKYRFNNVYGPHLDLETINASKLMFSSFGILNNSSSISDYSSLYFSPIRVKEVETYSFFISVNSYLRNEVPLLNTRVRKSYNYYMTLFKFFGVGVGVNYFTYPVKVISNNVSMLGKVLAGKNPISRSFIGLKSRIVLFCRENFFGLFNFYFRSIFDPIFIKIYPSVSALGAAHLGLNIFDLKAGLCIYSLGFNTDFVYRPLIYQGHHGNALTTESLIIMPTTIFSEKSATYLNLEGLLQKTHSATSSDKLVKKDWEVLRALSEFAGSISLTSHLSVFASYPFLKFGSLSFSKTKLLPFWVEGSSYYSNKLLIASFTSNYLFSLKILNYYWDDLLSQNSKIMAKCASLLLNNNLSYK